MPEFNADVREAVRHFWRVRQKQSSKQAESGVRDQGARGAATGGRQMDGFASLLRRMLVDAGVPASSIFARSRVELPGWFRAEKQWDLVVVHDSELIAAIELKSHVGSLGNNFNNRTEEALGSATDIWAAYREGAFKPSSRPFLGYLMLLEGSAESESPVKTTSRHFPVFPEFNGASYRARYSILIEKLLRDRLYDGACFIVSSASAEDDGHYSEPNSELTFAKFVAPLLARVALITPHR